jgi:disulfide bond formation protein DsbB
MTPLVQGVTELLSFFTLLIDLAILLFLGGYFFEARSFKSPLAFLRRHMLLLAFLVTLGSVGGSLFYSQVAGFAPCVLCWWMRVFLFPQAILFWIAWKNNDTSIVRYSIPLSVIGATIALYHTFLQFGGSPLVPCGVTGPSCTQRYFIEYSYVTIPTMALTAFVLLIFLSSLVLLKKQN